MKELSKNELLDISGGFNLTAAFVSAVAKGISTIMEVGRSFGTAIRRIAENKVCPL